MNVRTKVPTSSEQVAERVATVAPAHPIAVAQPAPKAYPPKIAKAILAITRALVPVKKAGANEFHKYQYPKWEDVLDELGPKMTEAGLIIQMDEVAHAGFLEGRMMEVTYEFTIINEDGDFWPDKPRITQMCKLLDQHGKIDDKAASKAHTQSQKYFLMQLFKIRVRDMEADDLDYNPEKHKYQSPARKRPVPTSTGKLAPHYVKTVEGDTAKSWATRFLDLFNKAESEQECAEWDKLNDDLLNELQRRAPDTYNVVVDAINAKLATFQQKLEPVHVEKKADPISTGGFPGDKPMKAAETGDIPTFLRRLTPQEEQWLRDIGGAFSGADDLEELGHEQTRLMTPMQGNVSTAAWEKAIELLNEHVERLGAEAA